MRIIPVGNPSPTHEINTCMSVHSGRLISLIKAEKINTDQYKSAYRQYKLCSSHITG